MKFTSPIRKTSDDSARELGPRPLRWSLLPLVVVLFLIASSSTTSCHGQWIEKEDLVSPFVDGEPFDLLKLNADGDNAIIKIVPLSQPLVQPFPNEATLTFEFADFSEDVLQVPYSSIEYYKSFNQLLIEEADAWLKQNLYAKSFRNLLYVYDHGGKTDSKLVQSLRSCLFQDGKDNFQAGRFELALSIFEDLYRQDPNFKVPGFDYALIEIVSLCYDGMIQKQFDSADFSNVRKTLAAVEEKYREEAASLTEKWNKAFTAKADELLVEARQFAKQKLGRQAHLASRQAEQMSPGRESVKLLQEEILKQFPLIVVGVSQDGVEADPDRIENWGARRVGRLTQRTMVEMTGLSDEGGKYEFLNGSLYRADEQGLQYVFEINSGTSGFATPPATAFQISSRLLAAANPESKVFDISWAKIVNTVAIENENRVLVTLRSPFVRPESLMNITYFDTSPDDQELLNGKYVKTESETDLTTYELNPKYSRVADSQHPVVVEQLFYSSSDAVDELIKGNIDVVDRVPPADVKRLRSQNGIVVRPYSLPTVHMLIPKIRGPLKDDLNFRSGLSSAINRQAMVHDVICDGVEISGCEPVSGPFPIGSEENDQVSYGYDLQVRAMPFNTKLGMVRIELAMKPTKNRPDRLTPPALVIAHPKNSSARMAAQAIATMWGEIGIVATPRELNAGESIPKDEQWDFLYLEVMMEEPLADATKIIGSTGFAKDISAPVEQTLRTLSYAESWRSACASLRRLHRQVSVDLSIIPLWQIKEHYAYRNTVRGIGRSLIHLYQNVDRWQIDTYGTDEQE